jgi:transposase
MVRDPKTGKYRRTRLFVLTLGCSRKAVRLLSFRSSSRIWAELHEKAFRRLGGSTRIVVLDNLKEGVLVPDIYDPALNPLFRDVLTYYGCVALPCRIQDPDRPLGHFEQLIASSPWCKDLNFGSAGAAA